MITAPIVTDIVLLGGGHTHVLFIRKWAMDPVAGVRITLISRDVLTPYSGMLPGFVAGHYSSDEIHIDLSRLCRWAKVRFIEATGSGINLKHKEVELDDRPSIGFDVLSIDTGSTPDVNSVQGADRFTVPVKPIHLFQSHWETFLARSKEHKGPMNISVVGSGVGGFELLLAMHHSMLSRDVNSAFHWVIRGQEPLRSRPERARQLALEACRSKNIAVHTGFDVVEVQKDGIRSADGRLLETDEVFWCTAAAAPEWPGSSGLETDNNGFIATNEYLQSRSHPDIFAVGDVATQIETPSAKAGVFAVRQAPVLFENIRRYILKQSLKVYVPQAKTLSLMALGEKSAIACRGSMTLKGDWIWRWKDYIDKSFMYKFNRLKVLKMKSVDISSMPELLRNKLGVSAVDQDMRCGGCGAKVAADVLTRTMAKLQPIKNEDVLIGFDEPDDAAVFDPKNSLMAMSVDQFRAMIEDPYLFGRIAALHAISDMHAMGAEPSTAMALVTIPYAVEPVIERELFQLMAGAVYELNSEGSALIGGHTAEGTEMSIGFAVNGKLRQNQIALKSGLQDRNVIILTKALGTGVILAADMRSAAKGVDVRHCIQSMLQSNRQAAEVLKQHGVQAMTDVTGFGLLGHLGEMLKSANVGCSLMINAIPVLQGARELAELGFTSTLFSSNRRFGQLISQGHDVSDAMFSLLCDPQTSGGLLASVSDTQVDACLRDLHAQGYDQATVLGQCHNAPTTITIKT